MATKPNETYKWGENATHEQVAAYEDTGWPSDIIPPKRTQFNWYQNLVGKWLGWAEDAVDGIVDTVLDAWFVAVTGVQSVPNKNGIYKHEFNDIFFMVHDGQMASVGFADSSFLATRRTWDGSQWVEDAVWRFTRANTRASILQESESQYVTPNGLVDYFGVQDTLYTAPENVPHQSGVYLFGAPNLLYAMSIVVGDSQAYIPFNSSASGVGYNWNGSAWVQQ